MTYPFALGTAQFGSSYGIINSYGYPSEEDANSILQYSFEKGINFFDTAFAYGNSLERICNIFSKNRTLQLHVVNKFSVNSDYNEVYSKLLEFLELTGLKKFYGLLIHDPQNMCSQTEKNTLSFLKRVKDNGIVDKVGISVYSPSDLEGIVAAYPLNLIQCPINLFNQSFLAEDLLSELSDRNIEIHARSLFLQGVLLADTLPPSLKNLKSAWHSYRKSLDECGIQPLEFIMSWIKSIKGIGKWVIGVNARHELSKILEAYDESNSYLDYDWSQFNMPNNPDIDPRTWNNK